VEVGGCDFSVWKIWLEALSKPVAGTESVHYADINMTFKISGPALVNEIKEIGVIIDRGQEM